MLKTYDETAAAFTEQNKAKYYDETAAAWVEAPSAKTYDTGTAAWVEHLDRFHYFQLLTYDFSSGEGGYIVNNDGKNVEFYFAKDSATGLLDHVSLVWEGEEAVTDSVFMGEFYTDDDHLDPDVYFYYQGTQVHSAKLRSQDGTLFGIPYSGSVDKIVINIVPYNPCDFWLISPWFGKSFKFDL